MTRSEKARATAAAGYRERFAMKNGKEDHKIINGHSLYIFRYDSAIEYQDGNGATFDATRGAWVD